MSKYPLFKLNDLASEWCKGQPFKKTDIAEHGQTPCIHYGELFTKYGVVINQCLSKTDVQGKRLSVYGDILFPASDVTPSGLARCSALTQDNVILGGDIIIMRPRSGNDSRYLSYAINYQKEQILQRVTGALIKHLSGNALKSVIIPVPPLADQVNLVSKLEKISELITFRKLQLEKIDQLASSRFIEMFGNPTTNPRQWAIAYFDEFALIDAQMTTDYKKYADYPHIGIDSIEKTTGNLVGFRTVKEDNVISGKYLFSEKHIIYSKIRPNLNKVALPDFSGVCSADAYPILPRENCSRIYLAFVMRSDYFLKYILPFSGRSNMPKVNREQLRGFSMPLPPIELQNEFATFIKQLDKSKVIGEKQGFMLEKITCYDIL